MPCAKGGTSCGRDFLSRTIPACYPFVWGQERDGSGGSAAKCQVPVPHSSCGPPTGCTSHPSDPVSLFLASNEAVNELDRSPTLPLELDG